MTDPHRPDLQACQISHIQAFCGATPDYLLRLIQDREDEMAILRVEADCDILTGMRSRNGVARTMRADGDLPSVTHAVDPFETSQILVNSLQVK